MIVLMPGERQTIAFDGVADKTGWAIVVDSFKDIDQERQVMTTEIVHQSRQLVVRTRFDQSFRSVLSADIVEQAFAPCGAALENERRVELVWAAVDPLLERLPAGLFERRLLQRSVFHDLDVP